MPSPMSTDQTIDQVVLYCVKNKICTVPRSDVSVGHIYGCHPVRIGPFVLDCHSHDTGNSVRIFVLADGKSLLVFNVPYWFSSSYTFNRSLVINGAWDKALDAALIELRMRVSGHVLGEIVKAAKRNEEAKAQQDAHKAMFERQFLEA